MMPQQPVKKTFVGMLEPEEVNYIPLSQTKGKACANCRWFLNDGCFIVESDPSEGDQCIIATGYCDRWEAVPPPMPDPLPELIEQLTEAVNQSSDTITGAIFDAVPTPPVSMAEMDGKALKPQRKSFKDRLADLLRPKPSAKDMSFSIFKNADGEWMWHSIHTNNYKDREGEILTEKAHDAYIDRLDMGLVPMPVLMAWHTPGSEHGEADVVWRNDHFIHAVGHFYDTPMAKKAIKYYERNAPKLKMSHGFLTSEHEFDGVHYHDYNTVEITTLPAFAAANPYTSFEEIKSMAPMTEEKKQYLKSIFGEDGLAELQKLDETKAKALDEMKVTYKDFTNPSSDPVTPSTPENVQTKALSLLYTDLVKSQGEIVDLLTITQKAYAAQKQELAAFKSQVETEQKEWQKAIDHLLTLLNNPRRAVNDPSTIVTPVDKLKDATPSEDPEASFLGAKVKSPIAR